MPCILLSAGLDETIIRQAELAEAFSVLAKPISRQQLTSTVEAAMRRIYNWDAPSPTRRTIARSKKKVSDTLP